MAKKAAFRGSITALVTPFQDGRFDEDRFHALVDWQIVNGTHGLVPVGTTGESPTLSHEEHRKVIAACVSEAKGRVPVIAGAGSNNTAGSDRTFAFRGSRRRRWPSDRHALLQQAVAGGSFSPFQGGQRCRGHSDHHLQYSAAFGRRYVDRYHEAALRIEEYRGRQGCDRQSRPHGAAAPRARARFHPAFGRRHDGTRGDGAWRPWLHFGHRECRAQNNARKCRRRVLPAISLVP